MRRYKILKTAALAAVLVSALSLVQAQNVKGSFNLPMEVHWGRAILAPGAYTFSMSSQSASLPAILQLQREGRFVGNVLTMSQDPAKSGESSLLLTQAGGIYAVRELRVGNVGVFTYAIPKQKIIRVAQDNTVKLPVSSLGK